MWNKKTLNPQNNFSIIKNTKINSNLMVDNVENYVENIWIKNKSANY